MRVIRLRCTFEAQTRLLLYATSGSRAREARDDQGLSCLEKEAIRAVLWYADGGRVL